MGSRSTYIALGTWRPELPVSKKVLKGLSRDFGSAALSRKTPSGPMVCSRQKSSQQAFPVWTPAWPTWIEMHSLWTPRSSTEVTEVINMKQIWSFFSASVRNNNGFQMGCKINQKRMIKLFVHIILVRNMHVFHPSIMFVLDRSFSIFKLLKIWNAKQQEPKVILFLKHWIGQINKFRWWNVTKKQVSWLKFILWGCLYVFIFDI